MFIKFYHKYYSFLVENNNLHNMSNPVNELKVACKAGSVKYHKHWTSNYVFVKKT